MIDPDGNRLPDREGEPEDTIDKAAVVGQALRDLDMADLVVELVQNELDAGSTRSVIDFGERALTCEGNGRPIDRKGWPRLETLLGAGGDVEAKRDGNGSKNHGLRQAFLLGDRIGIQSDGLRVDLTVRSDRSKPSRFKPGFLPRTADSDVPKQGVRITVPYRTKRLSRPDGDGAFPEPYAPADLDRIWGETLADSPERLVSASTPGSAWSYTLTEVWPQYTNFENRCFKLVRAVYVKARYSRHCRITDDELAYLGERVLRQIVTEASEERISALRTAADPPEAKC